ncbi:hypothetical protein [Chitinophaga sp. CF418]|nr:hypothetical protein [Chitinophaga sp. CF418]SHM23724.1 hypothetical protein SAMN05216311_101925 [Chitinophaga sp. CF418]
MSGTKCLVDKEKAAQFLYPSTKSFAIETNNFGEKDGTFEKHPD